MTIIIICIVLRPEGRHVIWELPAARAGAYPVFRPSPLAAWLAAQSFGLFAAGRGFRSGYLCSHPGRDDAERQVEAIREPRSFLATIANRVLVDHFRRHALEKAYRESLAQQPESVAISPEEQAIVLETLHELDAMLSGLGSKVRRAFLLSQLQGMRYADIARELGVSLSSVKKYMAKATESCLLYALEAEL